MRHEDGLRARTEGLTWIVWGMSIVPMILVWPAVLYLVGSDVSPLASIVLIPPWILMGGLASYALWRTAALAEPALHERRQAGLRVVLGYLGILLAAGLVGSALAVLGALPYTHPDVIVMSYVGIVWSVTGLWNPFGLSQEGKRISLVVGLATFAAAITMIPILGSMPRAAANAVAPLVALLTMCALPFAAGARQALRG
jgi:hypothetical protein